MNQPDYFEGILTVPMQKKEAKEIELQELKEIGNVSYQLFFDNFIYYPNVNDIVIQPLQNVWNGGINYCNPDEMIIANAFNAEEMKHG